jgi:hypothetical protein
MGLHIWVVMVTTRVAVVVVGILVAVADIQWQAVVVAQVMFRC